MARTYDAIDEHLTAWIEKQPMFFVASAPLAEEGHVNVSPKGPIETFRVLGPRRAAYLDLIGSGAETVAHLRENGRIAVMFCAFEGPPRIVRLHGTGEPVIGGDPRLDALLSDAAFDEPTVPEARRAVVVVDVERISSSCGYGVPLMSYAGERPHMHASKTKRLRTGGPDALARYVEEHNAESIDGLPAFDGPAAPHRSAAGHAIR